MLIAGATSASGTAAARALVAAGARVVAVGRDSGRLDALAADVRTTDAAGSVRTEVCDLGDEASVTALAGRIHAADGPVDGVLHLVGGWRGGGGLAGQTDADYRFLEGSFTALRHVTRAFDADLRESDAARLAIVSSTALDRPLAGGANYAAVKAASEAWARAVAQGFATAARDAGAPLRAASVVFRVKTLDGLESRLAGAYTALWNADAAAVNDTVIDLSRA
ncbi:SDR family oxidoreductase [Microbacterium terrae]|uniref:3-ketoacyl-(Acyl-carrier-protein) reductase n=1 Tax=Microbacterium terrae TaxID=69369 RepID=A0A0M2H4G6_9MICO|nr:SDR family NAD(P)-dependent oxidoreductase [Microbacterium terrae]KJL39346.1 3-ketoacyl-(acyl-carrier-protein) reductase [Microbacterium terrae]GLJ97846.1 oxidoreductase [Microbacterium terrae]